MLRTSAHPAQRPSADAEFRVRAKDLRPLGLRASEAGTSLTDILRGLGLPPQMNERSGAIGLADYFRVLERLSVVAHDEAWGLSRRPLLRGATEIVLSNLSGCTTLIAAMRAVARAYNVLHGGAYNRVELGKARLSYVIDDRDFPYVLGIDRPQTRFTMECVLIFLHGMLTRVAGDALDGYLRGVQTKSDRTGACTFPGFWPARIRWRARCYALEYDLAAQCMPIDLRGAIPSSHEVYHKIVQMIERKQHSAPRPLSLRERLLEAFNDHVFGQAAVAQRLGVSVATLRRRLHADGRRGFRELHDRARCAAARALLAHHVHPMDAAEELGFSDLRSFTRAFKRWTGITPVAYVRRFTRVR
jgi:AraC-like DNA-binding protein